MKINKFIEFLSNNDIDSYYAGVPDSLLKSFCSYLSNYDNYYITANEGAAVALCAGHYLSTNRKPVLFMQNSGIGNAINPLVSLINNKVYDLPLLLIIGWRGEPGVKDEPQHVRQGEITPDLLNTLGIPFSIINNETDLNDNKELSDLLRKKVSAILVRKGTFDRYENITDNIDNGKIIREKAIEFILSLIESEYKDYVIVSTTGMISRELYSIRESKHESHSKDFLTVGSMGHSSMIALGIAESKSNIPVFCFDGDGSVLMHMGSLAIIGTSGVNNLCHICFNNGSHASVGGQPTVAIDIDLEMVAKSCGYKTCTIDSSSIDDIDKNKLLEFIKSNRIKFINFIVGKSNRSDLGRPKQSPIECRINLMNYISKI